MKALVIVEHDNNNIHPATRNVLKAMLEITEKPVLLVMGHHCQKVAEQAATLSGVGSVWTIDHHALEHSLAENMAPIIKEIASSFTYIAAPASTFGKNILPRVAALLDTAQVSEVIRMVGVDTFEHPIYAGNAIETVKILDEKKIFTVRTSAFDAITESQPPCEIERIECQVPEVSTRFVQHELSHSPRPDLSHAKIVVAGGRGLQSVEKFKLIEALADVLSASVGASRAAVDAGFVSNDYQVGQTGKVVAPTLYFAIGISGAIQHLAGMKDSRVIVAINKDKDAPIFQIATYGLVGDLFTIVPELIELLKQRR